PPSAEQKAGTLVASGSLSQQDTLPSPFSPTPGGGAARFRCLTEPISRAPMPPCRECGRDTADGSAPCLRVARFSLAPDRGAGLDTCNQERAGGRRQRS